jgi:hypothetical protein
MGNQINGNSIYQNGGPGITIAPGLGVTTGNQINGNSIYSNTGPGVWIQGDSVNGTPYSSGPYTTGYSIEGNAIYGNGGLGIDLGDIPVDAHGNPATNPNVDHLVPK